MGLVKELVNWAQGNTTVLVLLVPASFLAAGALVYAYAAADWIVEWWIRRERRFRIPPFVGVAA